MTTERPKYYCDHRRNICCYATQCSVTIVYVLCVTGSHWTHLFVLYIFLTSPLSHDLMGHNNPIKRRSCPGRQFQPKPNQTSPASPLQSSSVQLCPVQFILVWSDPVQSCPFLTNLIHSVPN